MANKPSEAAKQLAKRVEDVRKGKIRWNSAGLKSDYANVCNVSSTREEVVLLFGTTSNWERGATEPVQVDLSNRLILNPYSAKRLAKSLVELIDRYEAEYGPLDLTGGEGPGQLMPDAAPKSGGK